MYRITLNWGEYKPIIGAPFTIQINCFVSKRERLQSDIGRKSRPNFGLLYYCGGMGSILHNILDLLRVPVRVRYKLCLVSSGLQSCSWHRTRLSADQTPKTLFLLDAARQHMAISRFHFDDRAFAVARLPATIRSSGSQQNFKNQLKAHFFDGPFFSFPFVLITGALN